MLINNPKNPISIRKFENYESIIEEFYIKIPKRECHKISILAKSLKIQKTIPFSPD